MKVSIRHKKQAARGAALVEVAVILFPLMSLLIGIFDFGQFLFVHQALVERARSSARWGITRTPLDLTQVQNMVLYNQPAAITGASGYMGLNRSMVNVTNPGNGTDEGRLTIEISNYKYTVLSPLIGGAYTGPRILVSAPIGPH